MPGEFKIAEAYADIRTDISKFSAALAEARAGMQTTREHMDLIGRSSLRMFAGLTNAADRSALPSPALPPSGTREDRFIALIEKQLDECRQQKEILRAVLNLMKKEGVVVGAVGP